jgi:hypothetical protein
MFWWQDSQNGGSFPALFSRAGNGASGDFNFIQIGDYTMFDLKDEEKLHLDLVARVCHHAHAGAVTHDTDITYLIRGEGAPFHCRDSVSENELIEILEKEGEEHGTSVFFIRWEEPGEWSML